MTREGALNLAKAKEESIENLKKRVDELRLENLELKKSNSELRKENAEYESEAREVNIRADKYIKRTVPKLVKAREIIIAMLPYMPKENIEGIYEIVSSAEEFVKNVFRNEEN